MNPLLSLNNVATEKYLNELRELILDDNQNILEDKYYEYRIEKWNNFNNNRLRKYVYPDSKIWRLCFHKTYNPKDQQNYISFCLKDYSLREEQMPYCVNIVMVLRNINDLTYHKAKLITLKKTYFNSNNIKLQFHNFIRESDLYEQDVTTHHSLVENDKMMVGFYVRYYKYDIHINYGNDYLLNSLFYNYNNLPKVLNVKEEVNENYNNKTGYLKNSLLKEVIVHDKNDIVLNLKYKKEINTGNNFKYYPRYIILITIIVIYYFYYYYDTIIELIKNKVMKEDYL
ncbi:hypothetical protein BCR36DRAFT_365831 [Piromyces finnis]|uniref:Uncharacterized protein n=1 Tax=Piromyces finnis TaxID=1754191 RepID=A0A1Y1VQ26_9FUNG|nr:hypothetical protein BCR36DRAFT_365831 [Piromyces finnis]|eukprot:ORX61252.1 hypothetical protein BCR36DRAFT_365831 [Piromyces finnis]